MDRESFYSTQLFSATGIKYNRGKNKKQFDITNIKNIKKKKKTSDILSIVQESHFKKVSAVTIFGTNPLKYQYQYYKSNLDQIYTKAYNTIYTHY